MFNADEYVLTINGPRHLVLPVVRKQWSKERRAMMNGVAVCTVTPHVWTHLRHEDELCVAPDMDIAVAVGLAWCIYDV